MVIDPTVHYFLKNKSSNIQSHLTDMDIQGALRDIAGDPVPKPGGGYFQHLKEVTEAKQGLKDKIIIPIQNELATNTSLSIAERQQLKSILSDASKKLDQVEKLVP